MDMQKQSFYEVDLLDEQLLPDNGLLIRTWSSIVSLVAKSPLFCSNTNQKSVSYSPRSFEIISSLHILRSSSAVKVALASCTLIFTPSVIYGGITASSFFEYAQAVIIGWDSLAHFSVYPVFVVTMLVSFYFAHSSGQGLCYKKSDVIHARSSCCNVCAWITPTKAAQIIVLFFSLSVSITSQLQIIQPSWIWNPALWMGRYKVYLPSDLQPALQGLCLDGGISNSKISSIGDTQQDATSPSASNASPADTPLCLSENS
jgi:hypothetical protein